MGGLAPAPEVTVTVWQNGEHALTRTSEKADDGVADHEFTRLVLP
jgi:hypothetical protein